MEPRFRHNFSKVRVHRDAKAAESARLVGATAYTVGQQIVFGHGDASSQTAIGRHLWAHELAHVVQQSRGGPVPDLNPSAPQEQDARAASLAISMGRPSAPVACHAGFGLARQTREEIAAELRQVNEEMHELKEIAKDAILEAGKDVKLIRPRNAGVIPRLREIAASGSQRAKAASDLLRELETLSERSRELNQELLRLGSGTHAYKGVTGAGRSEESVKNPPEHQKTSEARVSEQAEGAAGKIESEAAGAGKAESAIGKAESKVVGRAEGSVSKFAGLGAKAGRASVFLIELALPGPQDVLFLWIDFFGSLAAAKEKLRHDSYAQGFSQGLAARLLKIPGERATRMLIHPITSRGGIGEQVADFSGVRERAASDGIHAGWKFAGGLGDAQKGGFLKKGRAALKDQGKRIGPNVEPGTPKSRISVLMT